MWVACVQPLVCIALWELCWPERVVLVAYNCIDTLEVNQSYSCDIVTLGWMRKAKSGWALWTNSGTWWQEELLLKLAKREIIGWRVSSCCIPSGPPSLILGLTVECCLSSALLPRSSISLYCCFMHIAHLYFVFVCICIHCICIWCFAPSPSHPRTAAASTMWHICQSSSNQSSEVGAFLWFFSPSILQFMNLEGFIDMFWVANKIHVSMTLVSLFFHQSKLSCKIQDLVCFPDRC